MGRFKTMAPGGRRLSQRFGVFKPDHDATRRDRHAYRAWYNTARWRRLRWSVLVRDLFRCRRCGVVQSDTSKLVADHVIAHRGDEDLFWDEANLQCLCARCHNTVKQSEEAVARSAGGEGGYYP